MAGKQRLLTDLEREEVFRIATRALPNCYSDAITQGKSDSALTKALEQVLGIFGGSCDPDRMVVAHQA